MKHFQKLISNIHIIPHKSIKNRRYADSGKIDPIIMVHGGAGTTFDDILIPKIEGVKLAAQMGYRTMIKEGALSGVEQAVRFMDLNENFNSGKGSVLNTDGEVEMDALLMTGDFTTGAVTCVKDMASPISLARLVLDKTPCILLAGNGAMEFAIHNGIEILPPGALVTERAKKMLKHVREYDGREIGIVGALALDSKGVLAVGISSGGSNGRVPGRAGDGCRVGCSAYADNDIGAVAVTGDGESIIKACLAYSIVNNIKNGLSPSESIQKGLFNMDMRLHTTGGAIALSKNGEIGLAFNTKRMPWAYHDSTTLHFGVEKGEHNTEASKISI